MNKGYVVAVVGATGAVGKQMVKTLEERNFPIQQLKLLASKRSVGKKVLFKGTEVTVEEAKAESFTGVDIALFSAGGSISAELAPEAVQRGVICIDNTSYFRMNQSVPLVVPEVNEAAILKQQGIIANPNCSTIQMVVALEPIRKAFGLKKVLVSTYQAVSGAGMAAVEEMKQQIIATLNDEAVSAQILPAKSDSNHYPIAFNCIPQIDLFTDNGFTLEEMKMINETKKIMADEHLQVAATCVRLPIETGHSESVYIEVEKEVVSVSAIQEILQNASGIVLQDNPSQQLYPMPRDCVGSPSVFVGRIRQDLDETKGFHLWIVADNLLKGAAWNAVQIAESLLKLGVI